MAAATTLETTREARRLPDEAVLEPNVELGTNVRKRAERSGQDDLPGPVRPAVDESRRA